MHTPLCGHVVPSMHDASSILGVCLVDGSAACVWVCVAVSVWAWVCSSQCAGAGVSVEWQCGVALWGGSVGCGGAAASVVCVGGWHVEVYCDTGYCIIACRTHTAAAS